MFNVGVHATTAQLEKLLKGNGIAYKKARKPPTVAHGILSFEVRPERTRPEPQLPFPPTTTLILRHRTARTFLGINYMESM